MDDLVDWESLKVKECLAIDWHTKYIASLVSIKSRGHPEGATSVLLATKLGFDSNEQLIHSLTTTGESPLEFHLLDHNDIYYRYTTTLAGVPQCKLQLIHPATPIHIAKYTKQERHFITETPEIYQNIVKFFIEKTSLARVKWIDNILGGISEQDRVLFLDSDKERGFVIVPDSKWDQKSISSMYLLVIVARRDIRTLRDINATHLPLLKNIRKVINEVVWERYSLKADQLRVYIHYMPTYYYFHIHVVHVDLDSPGCSVGSAHLLDDVIDNIENISPDYYQRRTLHYTLGEMHDLYEMFTLSVKQ